MGFHERVAQIRDGVLKQPQYSIPFKELVERVNLDKANERTHKLAEKTNRNLEETGLEH